MACEVGGTKTTQFQATARYEAASLEVRALMMPQQSWVRSTTKTASLLAHEQGHFDVAHVMAEKIETCLLDLAKASSATEVRCGQREAVTAAATSLGKQPTGDDMQRVWNDGHALTRTIQTDYDTQSNHSKNTRKQAEWIAAIAAGLMRYQVRCPKPAATAPAAPSPPASRPASPRRTKEPPPK